MTTSMWLTGCPTKRAREYLRGGFCCCEARHDAALDRLAAKIRKLDPTDYPRNTIRNFDIESRDEEAGNNHRLGENPIAPILAHEVVQ